MLMFITHTCNCFREIHMYAWKHVCMETKESAYKHFSVITHVVNWSEVLSIMKISNK